MDQQETKRLIDEILNSLPDEQRVAVSMHYYQQKSIKEIAEELGISENTIKSLKVALLLLSVVLHFYYVSVQLLHRQSQTL